jgi:hypothetical protein
VIGLFSRIVSRTAYRFIHSFRLAVVRFVTSIELQFENELVTAAEVVMIDFCPCAADAAISILLKLTLLVGIRLKLSCLSYWISTPSDTF